MRRRRACDQPNLFQVHQVTVQRGRDGAREAAGVAAPTVVGGRVRRNHGKGQQGERPGVRSLLSTFRAAPSSIFVNQRPSRSRTISRASDANMDWRIARVSLAGKT